jgi:hypothetical protein
VGPCKGHHPERAALRPRGLAEQGADPHPLTHARRLAAVGVVVVARRVGSAVRRA